MYYSYEAPALKQHLSVVTSHTVPFRHSRHDTSAPEGDRTSELIALGDSRYIQSPPRRGPRDDVRPRDRSPAANAGNVNANNDKQPSDSNKPTPADNAGKLPTHCSYILLFNKGKEWSRFIIC